MTGNIALDVVIGLSFIFALYSLFATIIMELITSTLGLRARNLEYTIQRMLSDEKWEHVFKTPMGKLKVNFDHKVSRTLLSIFFGLTRFISRNKTNPRRRLYKGFFSQPSIKYLSAGGFHNKPSYISAENFSKALLDELKGLGESGATPLAKIQSGIDSLAAIPETKKHLLTLLEDANHDLQKFKLILENWFEDVQERSAGWFKRTTKIWLLAIGFSLAVSLDASTFKIVEKLSYDPKARQQMVEMASAYIESNPDPASQEKADSVRLKIYREQKDEIKKQMLAANNILALDEPIAPWKNCFWDRAKGDIWGYLLTALAISLGAPFWFDLLNKLVKLRGSVAKPTASAQAKKTTKSDQSILDIKG